MEGTQRLTMEYLGGWDQGLELTWVAIDDWGEVDGLVEEALGNGASRALVLQVGVDRES